MHPHDLFPDWPSPLPPHTQLIDGSFVYAARQCVFHGAATDLLVSGQRRTVPGDLRVCRQMIALIDTRNAPEPDITVVRAEATRDRSRAYFHARDAVLAVEVVSPESEARDRDTKPHKYAGAGIPHFWRVEMSGIDDRPTVHVFELSKQDRTYHPVAVHHERLKLTTPFDIDIDLAEIDYL